MEWSALVRGMPATIAVLGAVITALATVMLWRVTKVLAVETKRMAEASAQPQVVANIEPNQWAAMYADIVVANTGNATAFDVRVEFDPEIPKEPEMPDRPPPLRTVSLLRPGQKLVSYLTKFQPIIDVSYSVTVSWKRQPADQERETITYPLNLKEMDGRGNLGAADPMTQIATEVKNMRDDLKRVVDGTRHIQADVFTTIDRMHERRDFMRRRRNRLRENAAEDAEEKISGK